MVGAGLARESRQIYISTYGLGSTHWSQRNSMGAASSKLKVGDEIGRGAYGTVHKGIYEGNPVAVKKIHRLLLEYAQDDPEAFQRISNDFERECDLLKTLVCQNVVQFVGVFEIGGERVLVMELLHETLASALKRKKSTGGLKRKTARRICYDIACGLSYLHTRKPPLVHRDLNAKNILLTKDGTAKISDLGMSKFRPTDLGYLSTKAPGCLPYMPPEALGKDPKYTEKLDIFSFGVLMLQMATGEDPSPALQGIGVVPEVERRRDHIELVPSDHVLKKCMMQCLEDDPSKRPTTQEILFQCTPIVYSGHIVLAHGTYAGSTPLLIRYVEGYFAPIQAATLSYYFYTCQYADTRFMLWDTPGKYPYLLASLCCRALSGVAVVVDVTNMDSLESARFLKQLVDSSSPQSPLPAILLANKCDVVDRRKVSAEALAELAEELDCFAYMEVSALTGQNVKEAFHMLFDKVRAVDALLRQRQETTQES